MSASERNHGTRCIVAAGSNMLGDRTEFRSRVLRMAEITPFPREANQGSHRTGYALDESDGGLCLQLKTPVAVGAMLRVVLNDFDGNALRDEIVRVAWCRPRTGGRFNAGLEILHERSDDELLCVQHATRRTEVPVLGRD
jgi:hypothetical protein